MKIQVILVGHVWSIYIRLGQYRLCHDMYGLVRLVLVRSGYVSLVHVVSC